MARSPWSGNNVSHANNKTKRRFLPTQIPPLLAESENCWCACVSSAALRLIDKNGDRRRARRPARTRPGLNQRGSTPWQTRRRERSSWCPRPAPVTSTPRPRTRNHARQDGDFQVRSKARASTSNTSSQDRDDLILRAGATPSAQGKKNLLGSSRSGAVPVPALAGVVEGFRRGVARPAQLLRELRKVAMLLSSRRHQARRRSYGELLHGCGG